MSSNAPASQQHYGDAGRPRGSRGPAAAGAFPEQVVGSYVIGETVGKGSFGKVKRGRHIHTGETVAIKILNRQKLKSANMDKKIHREIEILQLFSHPNICRLYEVISTPTDMYLIMEFIEGGELYDYIVQKGQVREPEARYIFQQIVCALEYCHHFRVVHRDLKPENILLGPGLQVKLIDFGLSNIMKDGEFLTTSCGSPNYAAPEVISGKLYFGPEVDVWSCGVILYALLCGCLPFDEDTIPLLFSKIKKGKYSFPDRMPRDPRALIQQILLVDPLVRLTIPQIRDNAWFNKKLPIRLSYNESLFAVQEDRIIAVLASETAKKLSMREKDVRRELERGSGPAYVAYNILLDARRKKEIAAEVRELGVAEEAPGGAGALASPLQPKSPVLTYQASFEPKAMERELNMGLMLSPSPAMENLLEHGDANTNKAAYNTGTFVPASAQNDRLGTTPTFPGTSSVGSAPPPSAGSFSMKKRQGSLNAPLQNSFNNPGSWRGHNASGNSLRRTGLSTSAASQLGASFSDQPRVGSVARKHAMYTAEEEQFYVENNYGWRVGLMTDWHAEKAFQAVYNALKAYGMQWKVLSPFRVMARTTPRTWEVMDDQDHAVGPNSNKNRRRTGEPSRSVPIPISSVGGPSSASIPVGGSSRAGDERVPFQSRGYGSPASMRSGASASGGGGYFTGLDQDADVSDAVGSSPLGTGPSDSRGGSPTGAEGAVAAFGAGTDLLPPTNPPSEEVILCVHLFRIHERHEKGFLVEFSVLRNTMVGLDVVSRLSDDLIRRVV